jgi:small subunit ribosomal protein S17
METNNINRGLRKQRVGIVVSDKMDKTVVVLVERRLKHPIYKKYITRSKKFLAHDEKNECQIGDKVLIMETRPLSRRKRWRVVEIIEKVK